MDILQPILYYIDKIEKDKGFYSIDLKNYLIKNDLDDEPSISIVTRMDYFLSILERCEIIKYKIRSHHDSYNNIVILNKDYIKIKDIPFYKYFTEHELKKCTNENYRIIFERKCKLKMLKNEGI
jgi:hypothetical protein